MASEFKTKTEVAVQELKKRIVTGQLRPGDRLQPHRLVETLGMSPTPIREALRLLQADGHVSYRPHHGIIVAEFSTLEASEIYAVRATLEHLATQLAVPKLVGPRLEESSSCVHRASLKG